MYDVDQPAKAAVRYPKRFSYVGDYTQLLVLHNSPHHLGRLRTPTMHPWCGVLDGDSRKLRGDERTGEHRGTTNCYLVEVRLDGPSPEKDGGSWTDCSLTLTRCASTIAGSSVTGS